MGCISWLHLSDWHQSGVNFDRTVLRDKLLADIRDRSQIDPRLQSIDFVVFSGDASHRGTKAELETTRKELFAPLLEVLNLAPERLFLVPGNHDMDWGAHDLLPSGLQSPLTTDADVQKWLGDRERRKHVLRPFQAYTTFVTKYTGQPNPAYASVKRWTFEGRSVALLGLNSAWMSARNTVGGQVRDEGHLVIGEPQIHDALTTIADDDLRIVVMHHAFEWLAEFDRVRVESRLKSAADIILWGHAHSPQVRSENGTDGRCLMVPAGAAFDGRVAGNPRYTNAYNYAVLDLDTGDGLIHLRRWNDRRTCWAKDTDTCEEGLFAFNVPAKLTPSSASIPPVSPEGRTCDVGDEHLAPPLPENKDTKSAMKPKRKQKIKTAVIMTALSVEMKSVLRHLNEVGEIEENGTIFWGGVFENPGNPWRVAVCETGPGNQSAGVLAERALNRFRPDVMLFVGVAGGVKDVAIGDVVAGNKIYGYESGKETDKGFLVRPSVAMGSHPLEQRARAVANTDDWKARLSTPNPLLKAMVGPIAAGEKVMASRKGNLIKFLKENYNDTLAVEMEGRGFMEAVHVNPKTIGLVIRGISDLLAGKSRSDAQNSQVIASASAAAFAFEVLANFKKPPAKNTKSGFKQSNGTGGEASASGYGDNRGKNSAEHDQSAVSDEERQQCREQRFERLKAAICKALRQSPRTIGLLEGELGLETPKTGSKADSPPLRATTVCDKLIKIKFANAIQALRNSRNKIFDDDSVDQQSLLSISDVSGMLVPWLYVDEEKFDCSQWERKEIGRIIALPSDVISFAEIIMAGIDIRMARFRPTHKKSRWPYSVVSLNFGTVEEAVLDGNVISSADEENIRSALANALGIPRETTTKSPEKIDQSINIHIQHFLDEGERWYIICSNLKHPEDHREHMALMDKIAKRYKSLAVVHLEETAESRQEAFLKIRHLLDLEDNNP